MLSLQIISFCSYHYDLLLFLIICSCQIAMIPVRYHSCPIPSFFAIVLFLSSDHDPRENTGAYDQHRNHNPYRGLIPCFCSFMLPQSTSHYFLYGLSSHSPLQIDLPLGHSVSIPDGSPYLQLHYLFQYSSPVRRM